MSNKEKRLKALISTQAPPPGAIEVVATFDFAEVQPGDLGFKARRPRAEINRPLAKINHRESSTERALVATRLEEMLGFTQAGDVIFTDAAAFAAAGASGGWVTGELDGKTGSFPSNYVAPK